MPTAPCRLRMPIRNRNVPEIVGPIRPVAWCSAESSSATPPLSPLMPTARPTASRKTIARVAEREEEPDAQRPLAVAHQLARRVVDRADVVGVEGVAHAERVGGDADADAEDAAPELQVLRRDEAEEQPEARRRAGATMTSASRPARLHSAGVSEPDTRAHRELRAGMDRAAIEFLPRIVAARLLAGGALCAAIRTEHSVGSPASEECAGRRSGPRGRAELRLRSYRVGALIATNSQ